MDRSRLDDDAVDHLLAGVAAADAEVAAAWPGEPTSRQPANVLYVPADVFTRTTVVDAGARALTLLDAHAADPRVLTEVMGVPAGVAALVRRRVATKLVEEPVEDVRVDVEDGYLGRDEATEAHDVAAAARALAAAHVDGIAPPFCGIRVKSFTDGLARRSVASLDRFVGTLLDAAGALPDGFVVTFPKIVHVDHVRAFVGVLDALEQAHGLPERSLGFEAQVETTASVLGPDGHLVLRDVHAAADGRLRAAHLGVFDWTAGLGLPPDQQRLDHPACDHVRHLLQVTFAGTEVRLSDGSSNVRPRDGSAAAVHDVWRVHAAHVDHSLRHGFVQGWDLHHSHLVSRWATVFGRLLDGMDGTRRRLAAWDAGEAVDGVMDEPATVRRLQARVDRAVACGALDPPTPHDTDADADAGADPA